MATIEIVKMSDDLDPRIKNGVETVKFFDPTTGEAREIELGEKNREHFANHLAKLEKYLAASRVVAVAPAKPKADGKADKGELALIREWAKTNGYTVGDRGRIKADIVDAYHKAQGKNYPDAEVVEQVSNVVKDVPGVGQVAVVTSEPEDLGYSHDGEKIIPCPDGLPGCEVMHLEMTEAEQDEIDELLAEATGDDQSYTDDEIEKILAEIENE